MKFDQTKTYKTKGGHEYSDFKIDDKVLIWMEGDEDHKEKRYFAGVNSIHEPLTFSNGATSWSSTSVVKWDYCEKVEE